MKKHLRLLAGLAAIGALFGLCVQRCHAITIDSNPDNPQSYIVTRRLQGMEENVTNTFTYVVTGQASNLPMTFTIEFNDAEPVNGMVEQSYELDISQFNFPEIPGGYEFKIQEAASSDEEKYPISTQSYTTTVVYESRVDRNNTPTGEYYLRVAASLVNNEGKKSSTAVFETGTPFAALTSLTVGPESSGKAAKAGDVFKYAIVVHGQEGEEYSIVAPEGKYIFGDKEYENPITATANEVFYVYLRAGEFVKIGQDEEGVNQLRSGQSYTIEQYDENNYRTFIDNEDEGERTKITKQLVDDPEENKTRFINKKEPIDDFVDTGAFVRAAPYLALGAISILAIILVTSFKKKKSSK